MWVKHVGKEIIVLLHVMCFAKGDWGCNPQENYKILASKSPAILDILMTNFGNFVSKLEIPKIRDIVWALDGGGVLILHVDFKKAQCRPVKFKKCSCRPVEFKKCSCPMSLSF